MSIKGFKFSLETPLRIKIIRKNQLEADLLDAKKKMDAGIRKLDMLRNEEIEVYSKLETSVNNGIKVNELKEQKTYLTHLAERIKRQQMENEKLKKKYKDLQKMMLKLMKEIDKLEDLKKDKVKEFLKEMEKQEMKELEERINYNSSFLGGMTYG
ncbi:MAG: hypothetical protein GX160_10755 [Clostridiales bacterium]|nr:hypothetical protein [Clostridiales bacterium]